MNADLGPLIEQVLKKVENDQVCTVLDAATMCANEAARNGWDAGATATALVTELGLPPDVAMPIIREATRQKFMFARHELDMEFYEIEQDHKERMHKMRRGLGTVLAIYCAVGVIAYILVAVL